MTARRPPPPRFDAAGPGKTPPKPKKPEPSKRWTFSFTHWRQIDNFGIGDEPSAWFASLMDALRRMGDLTVLESQMDGGVARVTRYHEIDWGAENVPIQRSMLDWLPSAVTANDEEYPMLQFGVSRGRGRVVGYFDHEWTFQVVLLDPKHNIQPSKSYGYRVDATRFLETEFDLLAAAAQAAAHAGCGPQCGAVRELERAFAVVSGRMLYVHVDAETFDAAIAAIAGGKASSHRDIYESGICTVV